MPKIDETVIGFAVYEDATEYIGISEVTLPEISNITEEISGAGIGGKIESVILGAIEAMSLTLNFRTVTNNAIKLHEPRQHNIDLRAAQQQKDTVKGTTEVASVIIQERVNINESAKQNLPRYATGQNLDSLSEIFHNTYRLQPTAARTTLGFSIATALDKEYVITDEIEVTVDGYINFATTGYLTFPAGETYAEVEAVCTTLGEDGNGFTPGQVSRLVTEEFLYFKEVANTTETAGGSGEESDTAYYNRMRESEESYTTAGPRGSYIYHAKAVSSQISDVSAESPQDGVADIRISCHILTVTDLGRALTPCLRKTVW